MGISGDSAEEIVKLTLDGTEFALRVSGTVAKNAVALMCAMLKDQHESRGKVQLKKMLKENREIAFFEVQPKDYKAFAAEAKRYGVVYSAIKDKSKGRDAPYELMVRASDAVKINRIVEKLKLASVEIENGSTENPAAAKTENRSSPSEPILGRSASEARNRPSVRKRIAEISEKLNGTQVREEVLQNVKAVKDTISRSDR